MRIWEREFNFRDSLDPGVYQKEGSEWNELESLLESRKQMLFFLWSSQVPGSFAPDSMFASAVQAWENQGYDITSLIPLMDGARAAAAKGDWGSAELLTGRLFGRMFSLVPDGTHESSQFLLPQSWEDISRDFPIQAAEPFPSGSRIYHGWLGQICGGSYGTALEGYTGRNLRAHFGDRLSGYTTEPETYNDDITFELALLDAVESLGEGEELTSDLIGESWLKLLFFGYSAEHFALENLRRGLFPPESGSFRNPFSEWIGAQMRTMVCGLLAPGDPRKAARLAWLDSRVSHTGNGIYGGIHSAVLTSLSFLIQDEQELLHTSRQYIPEGTMFRYFFDLAMKSCTESADHLSAWETIEGEVKRFHWIHVIPNMAAVVTALWFGKLDFTLTFRILGELGLDVDCNAGEVGTILGIINNRVDDAWAGPIGDELKTYVPGMERLSIRELAEKTVSLGTRIGGAQ